MMHAHGKPLWGLIALLVAARLGAADVPTELGPSPVQEFRQLLVLNAEERAVQLELRPPGLREPIEAKVKEYLALPAAEREVRLQATELRHYLSILLPLPSSNRVTLLPQIAEPMRSVVAARLDTWNIMLPSMQQEVIENERVVGYFTQLGMMTTAQRKALVEAMPAEQRAKLEADIKRWRAMPEPERGRTFAQFNQFFTLTPEEREKALSHLSEEERESMRATLDAFEGLTPEQRKICIRSFQKFANLSLAERQEFLKKAEAWQRMTPAEREQWREVVAVVPQLPPLPPDFFPAVATTVAPAPLKTNVVPAGKTTNGG